jgi:hypothetical protein
MIDRAEQKRKIVDRSVFFEEHIVRRRKAGLLSEFIDRTRAIAPIANWVVIPLHVFTTPNETHDSFVDPELVHELRNAAEVVSIVDSYKQISTAGGESVVDCRQKSGRIFNMLHDHVREGHLKVSLGKRRAFHRASMDNVEEFSDFYAGIWLEPPQLVCLGTDRPENLRRSTDTGTAAYLETAR